MSHERDLADQDVEEVAEELWTLGEQGSDRLSDLRDTTQVIGLFEALKELARRGLVRVEEERVHLTPQGRELAARQVRRHRLAEALFTTVLEVHDDEVKILELTKFDIISLQLDRLTVQHFEPAIVPDKIGH